MWIYLHFSPTHQSPWGSWISSQLQESWQRQLYHIIIIMIIIITHHHLHHHHYSSPHDCWSPGRNKDTQLSSLSSSSVPSPSHLHNHNFLVRDYIVHYHNHYNHHMYRKHHAHHHLHCYHYVIFTILYF